jgi:hypothetical protein
MSILPNVRAMGLMDDGREKSNETEQSIGSGSSAMSKLMETMENVPFSFNIKPIQETGSIIGNLIKETAGFTPKGSIDNFQNPTPEQIAKGKERKDAAHSRLIFNKLADAKQNAQRFAHDNSLNMQAKSEVMGMSSDEKKKKLHVSVDLDNKHIDDAYHVSILYTEAKAAKQAAEDARKNQEGAGISGQGGINYDKKLAPEQGPASIYNAAG